MDSYARCCRKTAGSFRSAAAHQRVRRDEQHPPVDALARLENNGEAAITALHVFNFHFAKLNRVVTPKLIAADLQELRWRRAIAREDSR